MSNETFNIANYKWQTYQEVDKVMIKPVNPHEKYFYIRNQQITRQEWIDFNIFCVDHTYQAIDTEPGIEIEGDRLEGPILQATRTNTTATYWQDIDEDDIDFHAEFGKSFRRIIRYKEVTQPSESKEVENKSAQLTIGDTSFTKLADGFIQILTKNGCVELVPDEIIELAKFIKS